MNLNFRNHNLLVSNCRTLSSPIEYDSFRLNDALLTGHAEKLRCPTMMMTTTMPTLMTRKMRTFQQRIVNKTTSFSSCAHCQIDSATGAVVRYASTPMKSSHLPINYRRRVNIEVHSSILCCVVRSCAGVYSPKFNGNENWIKNIRPKTAPNRNSFFSLLPTRTPALYTNLFNLTLDRPKFDKCKYILPFISLFIIHARSRWRRCAARVHTILLSDQKF